MKFKYFLRGLGTGIIFASLVCIVAFYTSDSKNISDKEVIERAKELGMVEKKDSVKDMFAADTEKTADESSKKDTEHTTEMVQEVITEESTTETVQETTTEESATETVQETTTTETGKETITEEQVTEQKVEDSTKNSEETSESTDTTVSITIKGGMSSYPVCQKLQELGMIQDATDFDNYLIKNGYANRIRVGTHTLTIGMSYEAIAIAISDPR